MHGYGMIHGHDDKEVVQNEFMRTCSRRMNNVLGLTVFKVLVVRRQAGRHSEQHLQLNRSKLVYTTFEHQRPRTLSTFNSSSR